MTDKPDLSDSARRKARIAETAAALDEVTRSFEKFVLSRRGLPGVDAEEMERMAGEIRDRRRSPGAGRAASNRLGVYRVLTPSNTGDLK